MAQSVRSSPPAALALDFDGVLCNGLREYFQTALQTYRQIWSDSIDTALAPADLESAFGRLRPVVETGWEMPLVLRALYLGWQEADILADWPTARNQLLVDAQLEPEFLAALVDTTRDQWITQDLSGWLALHDFYPGVIPQLQSWLASDLFLFIITTKESRFVQALLSDANLDFPLENITGKDAQRPKGETLKTLTTKIPGTIWFVEDRLATLQKLEQDSQLAQVELFLGDWGYNTPAQHHTAATSDRLHLLPLSDFTKPLEQWL